MALSCKLTRNILKSTNCGYSLPEVTEIYLVAYEDVTAAALESMVTDLRDGEPIGQAVESFCKEILAGGT